MGNVCYVPLEGGNLLTVPMADPAAGVNWLYTFPAGYECELRTLHFKCNTSAAVANRVPIILLRDNAALVRWTCYFSQLLAANHVGNFDLYRGASRANYSALLTVGPPAYYNYNDALPAMRILPGWTIGAFFDLLDVADTYTEIRLLLHTWRTN